VERITKGIETPELLAVDSKGWLYVDNCRYTACDVGGRSGGISVYAPGSTQPGRRVRVENAVALAIDPSNNLYVLQRFDCATAPLPLCTASRTQSVSLRPSALEP
jgi:hypothetical protein